MKPLVVRSVSVKDVLGITEAAIEPGRITVISGKNGSSKTSLLEAVQAALGGGNLARLARVGAEDVPEVVLVLEGDGNESYRVERQGEKVRVRARVGDTAAFEDVGRPQGWLTNLFDPRGSNPVRFLVAKDADRALMLLEALPLTLDRAELGRILGDLASHVPPIPAGLHPLEELAMVREGVFRARTGVNRDQKGKASAADQTRRNAPAVVPEDPRAQIEQGQAAVEALAQEIAREEADADGREAADNFTAQHHRDLEAERITGEFKTAAAKLRTEHEHRAGEIRAAAERRVAELAGELETAIDAMRTRDEATLDGLDAALEGARNAARQRGEAARAGIEAKRRDLEAARVGLAVLRTVAQEAARARGLHEQAQQFEAEAAALVAEGDRMTAALDALDAFRRRMAEDLPIPGLEIEGKQIRVGGIPFDQLNTAQRIELAVQVACLRAKGSRLPVVFVDGAEALDTDHFRLLVAALDRAGVQAFLGRVDDHELQVETVA